MRSFPSVIPSIWSYSALISRHAKGRSKGPPNAEKCKNIVLSNSKLRRIAKKGM